MTRAHRKLIYLSSPHAHIDPTVREFRYQLAMKALAQLIQLNYLIYSPIVHYHEMAKIHKFPASFTFWKEMDEDFIVHCGMVFVLMIDGWEASIGVKAEIELALNIGVPVTYIKFDSMERLVVVPDVRVQEDFLLLSPQTLVVP